MSIKTIQQALQDQGIDPGPIDGILGRKTVRAIKQFQTSNNLVADGLVGPQTSALLFKGHKRPENSKFDIPVTLPWMDAAFRLIGTQENPGRGSNEAILGWAEDLEITSYNDDDIPWCGLFVAHCVGSQLAEEPLPTNPLGARKWSQFGDEVSPRFGSVLVFWRGSRNGWKGHVGFYWAEDDDAYHVLGGNQSDSVSVTRISKSRLITARWPHTGLPGDVQIRIAASNGKLLSVNEA
ncbi:TIGR02594 family protein [Photobacterium frigidiphilum]|uniref:TIGR02594 family protein n=1 Tax=Photobacterium frigidiphilum TaxID=264736 RepID=A0A2T3JAM4_9GAMM|nr:TIGR02594 family protein [Photobacterium frigidiphilum]PSU45851.1 TIGR02594 family protein [Photobacterium frigidiphilum]